MSRREVIREWEKALKREGERGNTFEWGRFWIIYHADDKYQPFVNTPYYHLFGYRFPTYSVEGLFEIQGEYVAFLTLGELFLIRASRLREGPNLATISFLPEIELLTSTS